MITYILIVLVIGYVIFELIEHVLFPLVWAFSARNRKSLCGNEGLLGKEVEVRSWQGGEGRVFIEGELWNAAGSDHLQPGDKAFVQEVDGLVLKITSSKSDAGF